MHTISRRRILGLSFGDSRPPSLGLGLRLRDVVQRGVDTLLTWQERATQRAALAGLDERMLQDIGLTRADAMAEAGRPFWRA